GQACRPLPVLPCLHDHLPVGRELHASRRPGAGPDRARLPTSAARAALALGACARAAEPEIVPLEPDARAARKTAGGPVAAAKAVRDAGAFAARQGVAVDGALPPAATGRGR